MVDPHARPVPLEKTREQVIRQLAEHYAADNLTTEALEERLDRATRVATLEELRALVSDLPALRDPSLAGGVRVARSAEVPEHQVIVGIMGGGERKGVWTVPRQLSVLAVMGGAELDMREAHFGPGVTEINVLAIMGGAQIIVPPGVRVEMSGVAVMGGFSQRGRSALPTDPDAPVLRIGGFALMGGVEVDVRLPGERGREARAREREQRRLGR